MGGPPTQKEDRLLSPEDAQAIWAKAVKAWNPRRSERDRAEGLHELRPILAKLSPEWVDK